MKTRLFDYEVKFWLEYQYPLTVINDRYNGIYSGAKFTAWPRDFCDIEREVCGGDSECQSYWDNFDDFVGRGSTIDDAIADLYCQLQEEKDCEFLHCQRLSDRLGSLINILK